MRHNPPTPAALAALVLLAGSASLLAVAPSRLDAQTGGALAVQAGTLRLTATMQSIGVELPFTGDANGNAAAGLEFRAAAVPPAEAGPWRSALPLWRTDDGSAARGGPGAAFYGSALLLTPGTAYELRVTLADPDGVAGSSVLTGSVATRADDLPAPETLAPTHFVSLNGDDAAGGTTPASAWRTLDKAVRDAPDGAVVQVGPGHFTPPAPNTVRTRPLTLVAQYPAVDENRVPINEGLRSVVEPAAVSSPAGSDGPSPGPWQRVTLTGPGRAGAPPGGQYAVWRWAATPVKEPTQLGYAPTRDGLPLRVAHWFPNGPDLATPEGWAEKLYTNRTYNYGFYATGNDVYLRLPGDMDPNGLYLTAGTGAALVANGPQVRVSGLEIRQFEYGVEYRSAATFGTVDHCLLSGNFLGVRFVGRQGPTPGSASEYGSDHLVEHNLIRDSNLWSDDPSAPGIPWVFVKQYVANADGSVYQSRTSKIGRWSETVGISARGGARRVVIRFNTVEGTFDAVGGYHEGFDRYSMQDADVHDNLFRHLVDDGLDIARGTINYRIWNNRIEQSLTALSTGPTDYGPLYFFRNEAWRTGSAGVGRSGDGRVPDPTIFKYSGRSRPAARIYVLHNTLWTDQTTWSAVNGGAEYADPGNFEEAYYLRNNVIRATRYAYVATGNPGKWDEDYNDFSTGDITRGLQYAGPSYRGSAGRSVADYRAASGQGAHTNTRAEFVVVSDAQLKNPAAGDLHLAAGSPFVDAGIPVPNLSDRPGIDFLGPAPDLGAHEASQDASALKSAGHA